MTHLRILPYKQSWQNMNLTCHYSKSSHPPYFVALDMRCKDGRTTIVGELSCVALWWRMSLRNRGEQNTEGCGRNLGDKLGNILFFKTKYCIYSKYQNTDTYNANTINWIILTVWLANKSWKVNHCQVSQRRVEIAPKNGAPMHHFGWRCTIECTIKDYQTSFPKALILPMFLPEKNTSPTT